MEQRPNQGIWGGMISLPQFENQADLKQFLGHHGTMLTQAQQMASFTHVFSHFKLHITPWWIKAANAVYEPKANELWLNTADIAEAALPAPVSKLLDGIWAADQLPLN